MKPRPLTVGLVIALLTLASCSTAQPGSTLSKPINSGTSSAPSATSPAPSSAGSDLGTLKAKIDKYRAVPEFSAPGPAIDVSAAKGKSVFIIPETDNVFNKVNVSEMKTIADEAGLKTTIYENTGQASQWVQGMQNAVAQKPDLIILANAPDPRNLQPQISQAKEAGIPVLVTHFYDDSAPQPPACEGCAAGVTALETAPFQKSGELLTDWVIAEGGPDINALVVQIEGLSTVTPFTEAGVKGEFAKYCPKCKYQTLNIPFDHFASSKLQDDIQAKISSSPGLNWIIAQVDAMVPAVISALNTAGLASKVKVVSYNGSTFAIDDVRSGDSPMVMDLGESAQWIAYSTMDQAFRILLGQPTVQATAPVRIFDSTNAADAGAPADITKGYGTDFIDKFKALWGLK